MGTDKAVIEVNGTPLFMQAARKLAEVSGSVRLVGDPARYVAFGLPVVPDNFPGRGPLAGVEAALKATDTEWNLVVACDMPALETSILHALFESGADCALPAYADGQVEPLCAVYNRRCHAIVAECLEAGIRKVTDAVARLAEKHAVRYVPVISPDPFTNLNTPEDVRSYRDGHRHG